MRMRKIFILEWKNTRKKVEREMMLHLVIKFKTKDAIKNVDFYLEGKSCSLSHLKKETLLSEFRYMHIFSLSNYHLFLISSILHLT